MATPDPVILEPVSRAPLDVLPAVVRVVEPLRVLTLRCLPGHDGELAAAAGPLPGPGRFNGEDTRIVWRSPGEWLQIGTEDAPADAVLQTLPVGAGLAQATELSAGSIVFELQDAAFIDALLPRLLDASVQLAKPGQGTRARLADIAVVGLRLEADRLWLLADRANDHYLAHWLAYAAAALPSPQ